MNVKTMSKRSTSLLAAGLLLAVAALPLVHVEKASAYGQITERAIKLSKSDVSATSVDYEVTFKPASTSTIKSIAVDFCANTPIINDTCTATPGTTTPTISAATVTTTGGVNTFSALTWTVTATNTNRTFTIANATGEALTAGTAYVFTISGVTNQSTNGSFYSRVLTFPDDAASNYAGAYTGTNVGTIIPTDAGGIALSLAAQITVTAKVQERLSFCVYTGVNCGAGGTAVTLGNTNGVLDPNGEFVDKNTQYDVSTNAANGVAIRVKGATLTSTPNTIASIGSVATTPTPGGGNPEFGFCNYQATGSGLTPAAPYDDSACNTTTQTAGTGSTGGRGSAKFALDTANTTTTYGQVFANKTAGNTSKGVIAFVGNISNGTPAGIYTTQFTFIATGTY